MSSIFSKMKIIKLIVLSSILFCSCTEKKVSQAECEGITELVIVNKTENKRIADSSRVTDKRMINEFCKLLMGKTAVPNPKVKANFGYFEVILIKDSDPLGSIDIIYTIYDGVIIRDINGDYFKQDGFVEFIIRNSNNP
jgi:hypothetical protein